MILVAVGVARLRVNAGNFGTVDLDEWMQSVAHQGSSSALGYHDTIVSSGGVLGNLQRKYAWHKITLHQTILRGTISGQMLVSFFHKLARSVIGSW